MVYIDVVSN